MNEAILSSTVRFFTCVAGVLVTDWISKWLASTTVKDRNYGPFTYQTNEELALGVVGFDAPPLLLATIALLATSVGIHATVLARRGRLGHCVLGLGLGGATANIVDRTFTGAVHDVLNIGPAIINIADLAIVFFLGCYVSVAWKLAGDFTGEGRA